MYITAAVVILSCALYAAAEQGAVTTSIGAITVSPTPSLPTGTVPTVDPAFAGFAFEARSFWYYAGPDGKPNKFSQNLVQAITNKTKTTPIIRVGGTSLDNSFGYDPNQEEPIIPPNSTSGIPRDLTFGPSYLSAFANFPEARYILDVPFAKENHSNSLLFIEEASRIIGSEKIFAIELGNEVNLYPGGNRPGDWNISDYVSQWTKWTSDIDKSLNMTDKTKIWQAAAISAMTTNSLLPNFKPNNPWEIPSIFDQAGLVKEAPRIKSASIHYYQTKVDENTTLQSDIMNHTAITVGSKKISEAASYLNNLNDRIPLALAEVGSSLGNGSSNANLQAVLGSALWQADFMLQQMSIGVNKINSQSGVVFDFSLWSVNFSTPSQPRNDSVLAPFYGQIFAAEFIGSRGSVQVKELELKGVESDVLSAYGSYESGKLAKVAVVNMQFWSGKSDCSSSQSSSSRPVQNVVISVPANVKSAQFKTLTSPCGADAYANEGITWGGMSWNTDENDGVGKQVMSDHESVRSVLATNRTIRVPVAASEAVMIYLEE
ncbi:uncharacterized protein Z518_05807 [Rhinocladiella mackenziei CBS 650.93]|uniref:Rhinocladiella mackenziei CBS 650.93 unplaced genomic scaffold supercont1.4, whole genome shotgun sequence n=1 Tax=Rhinocladiella mackenziei CBS 650.93 TaxID=1442369 RepID=A0A0D2IP60_9EURO|nr:uncharacterized protein Z518_05807 [Rhinocladiella mackenziei CBS 650.93]KIX04936.1 hypothetical protein Z518_05807 [Rhinocladiella mackenziei CBS 650.93]